MANGSDSEEYRVISHVRPGLKRELAFALKSQFMYAGSIGRKRTRRSQDECSGIGHDCQSATVAREEGPILNLLEAVSEWEKPNDELVQPTTEEAVAEDTKTEEVAESEGAVPAATRLEMKISKKIALKKFPTKLKELLETGLLEGLPVRYLRGAKVRGSENGLPGIIKGAGVLCSCDMCAGTQIVTPNQFEVHAGSANKRPPDYIYLENGNNLRDVLNACKNAPPDMFDVIIQNIICSTSGINPTIPVNFKGSTQEAGTNNSMLPSDSYVAPEAQQSSDTQLSDSSDRLAISISSTNPSDKLSYSNSSQSKSLGRLTRKDVRMHKLVFEGDALPEGTELGYYVNGKKVSDGYKKGSAIICKCCNKEVSPSQFEAHAGYGSRRKPYLNIYTSNGVSLHEYSIRLSKARKSSAAESDDLCSICADGGDLLLCDNCPRAFHSECVSLSSIPNGTWYCKYCENMFQKEKFVEHNANARAAGRIEGIDPIEQITMRCIRIVGTPEAEAGGCVLCRGSEFSKSGFDPKTVILCDQCEREYHVGCLRDNGMDDLEELPKGKWFCCMDCDRIHSTLQRQVTDGEQELPESLLSVIEKKQDERNPESSSAKPDIRWRLLNGGVLFDESRLLLSKAVSIFHDQFDPIADSSTSSLDLIPHMVYGRKFGEQEFSGMYCAVITVNSTVVSAATFRVFGLEVAELPIAATSNECQGQGYFQLLFACIQNLLQSLHVRTLVLPAADEAKSIWNNKFGFAKMTEKELKEYQKDYQLMFFQGTSMLHKSICRSPTSGAEKESE